MKNLISQKKYLWITIAVLSFFSWGTLISCGNPTNKTKVSANAVYKKASSSVSDRVEDLLRRMTVEEKIGQMTQIEKGSLKTGDVSKFYLGSVLSGGGGTPSSNTPSAWADMVDSFQKEALSTRLGIPILYGVDSVHGHNNLKNATIFPHNIGLGATGDADLVRRIGKATALETSATGIPWTFAPCIAIARDPRWGRTYESFGQDSDLVSRLGAAFIQGYLDADTGSSAATITTSKHFIGDGGTQAGTSKTDNYSLDQGNTVADEAYLRDILLPPYLAALESGARTVMVSFSSLNGIKMHAREDLLTGLLKNELGFSGFVVSDWGGMDQIDSDYYTAMVAGINAGVDMNMVPYKAEQFISVVTKAIEKGDIKIERINDAVRRILTVKFESGLFEKPYADRSLTQYVRAPEHVAIAREAVSKSLVILENSGVLPLSTNIKKLHIAGIAADDIGYQCGGWTIDWQGKTGRITEGTTILDGIKEQLPDAEIIYNKYAKFDAVNKKDICLVVVAESPYAEGKGDSMTLSLRPGDLLVIERAKENFDTVILVLLSGRPLVMEEALEGISAFVCAWLPGTEGDGITDVLFSKVKPTGKLPFAWLRSTSQLPLDNFISGKEIPRYPAGYGLSW